MGAEILAFQYGHRKDELTHVAEQRAEEQRKALEANLEEQRKSYIAALKDQLSEAEKKVAELGRLRQPRHLSDAEKAKLRPTSSGFLR